MTTQPTTPLFTQHVKPHLGRMLAAVGLDVEYIRGSGDTLYYRDAGSHEVPVLDLLCGYGSLIFGHNHPQVVEHARQLLAQQVAVHAQFSIRGMAGTLARHLTSAIARELGSDDPYLVTYGNSGAEAVEAAIKHAELDRILKLTDLLDEISCNIETARKALRNGSATVPEDIYEFSEHREHVFDVQGFEDLIVALVNYNSEQLAKRPVFLVLERSFHGKLIGSVQLTYNKNFRRPFQYFGLKTRFVPMNEPAVLQRIIADERLVLFDLAVENGLVKLVERELPIFSAFIIEPIQGEGGIHVLTPEFARSIRATCNQVGCPLVIDEIQSGMGRAGSLLASTQLGLRGDYYTLSKSLGGGIAKISATLIRKTLYRKEFGLIHSSTFADDDFSCAIALKVLEMLEHDAGRAYRLARERGERIKERLQQLQHEFPDIVKDVRGMGLFLGIEFQPQDQASSMILRGAAYAESLGYLISGYLLHAHAIRIAPTGSAPYVLRLEPSLNITDADIDHVQRALTKVCQILRQQDALHLVHPLTDRRRPKPRNDIRDFRSVWGQPAPSLERSTTRPVRKVAFINHLISPQWLRQVDPSLADLSDAALRDFVLRMDPMKKTTPYPPLRIHSPLGTAVDFILYPLCVCSEQMGRYLDSGDFTEIRDDIEERIRAAQEDGCEIAGLGMYTSIVTNNCTALRIPEMALTSGNALTVAMGVDAIEHAARKRNLNLTEATLVVVGAAGNIASTYCMLLAQRVSKIILLGSQRSDAARRLRNTVHAIYQDCWQQIRTGEPLAGITARLAEEPLLRDWVQKRRSPQQDSGREIAQFLESRYGADPYLIIGTELEDVQRGALVLTAANDPQPFLSARHFARDAIVCDIAVPSNVVEDIERERSDLLYMKGGIVATPNGESLHPGARAFLGAGQLFACMAETAILGLAGFNEHYSYGAISRHQVCEIAALAKAHGFHLADFKSGHSL